MSMTRLVAIESGGDWTDACVNYLVVPVGVEVGLEHAKWRTWYRDEYVPAYREWERTKASPPRYRCFSEWLVEEAGASEAVDEIEVFHEG